jgi:tRNA(Ile)-lysidine synthase
MTELLSPISATLAPYLACQRWYIAYSGGLDSHVLLHFAWRLRQEALRAGKPFPELCAIHVNHQLQADSLHWAAHCASTCNEYGIAIDVRAVSIEGRGQGVESLARAARYKVFEDIVDERSVLLMAHHQDDQAETFLLRLMRGAGAAGLAAMPVSRPLGRAMLFRPLLNMARSQLEAYAAYHRLESIDDPSNRDPQYRRNFLRHRVMPVLAEVWPAYRYSIARAAELQAETNNLLSAYLSADVTAISDADGSLDLKALMKFDALRQRAVLRHYVLQHLEIRLDRAQSEELVGQFLHSSPDSQPVFELNNGMTIRSFRGRLSCERDPAEYVFDRGLVRDWDGRQACLISGLGRLSVKAGGEFVPRGKITVRFRSGGERCRIAGHAHSRPLKKLLQEWSVPPWKRDVLPLIYCDDEIAAIADIAICEGFQAAVGEPGLSLRWLLSR